MSDEANGGTWPYRVGALERAFDKLETEISAALKEKASVRDLDAVLKTLEENTAETKSLRKTILAFTVTLASAAVVFALSVLQGSLA